MTNLTEDEFIERYSPEQDEDGGYYRQRDWSDPNDAVAIEAARDERRLWTALEDDDGNWCLSAGYHRVNRLYYVICEKPFDSGKSYTVLSDEGFRALSVNRLAAFVWDGNFKQDYINCLERGEDPTDHILWDAALILGCTDLLPKPTKYATD